MTWQVGRGLKKSKVQVKQNSQMLLNLACFLLYNHFGVILGWYIGTISEMPLGFHCLDTGVKSVFMTKIKVTGSDMEPGTVCIG